MIPRDDEGTARRPLRRWTIVAAVAVLLTALAGVSLWYTGRPEFCETCHEMEPTVASWRAGTHARMDCFPCHADPGPVGYLEAHVGEGLRDLVWHFTRNPDVARGANVPPERCVECHEDELRSDEVPEDHPGPAEDCAECHRDAIHEGHEW